MTTIIVVQKSNGIWIENAAGDSGAVAFVYIYFVIQVKASFFWTHLYKWAN